MGWKASCILINEDEPGYLGTILTHDKKRARRLIRALDLGKARSLGMTTLMKGLRPDDLVVGAYDGAAIVAAPEVVRSCFSAASNRELSKADPLLGRVFQVFPRAEILCLVLDSVVDLFGYAYYVGGTLARAFGGSDDDPVSMDMGDLQPEEQAIFEKSFVRHGQRIFTVELNGETEEVDAPAVGVQLAFEMTRKFFGCRMDQNRLNYCPLNLQVELFDRGRPETFRVVVV